MKILIIALLTVFYAVGSFCQEQPAHSGKIRQSMGSMERSLQAGQDFPDYPQLKLPDKCRDTELPAHVDNSLKPYLRPVFEQQGASCGQAASVAYNFCYEINRLRNLPSDTSINQYPDHFVWNFMNGTSPYYGFGVSYFHTFDILYDAGNPTEDIYGPRVDDNYRWMDGYESYFQAMHNRISGINSIHAGTYDGLLTLKHWLHNHLEGSEIGGLANFYAGMPDPHILPAGTPEAGKHVQTSFQEHASHAMTIVGYNDSIRYDVNNDGMFTNHLDITGDGTVDMQDWEIGGLKYVNSYGTQWADSGFCYMLYRTLAIKYGLGGIWNNSVHVIHPDINYSPLLTVKAAIEHNKRGRLRITAGISSDTARYYPEHTMSFSIFNFQGLDYYMEGNNQPDGKSLEFGLDITPLLNYSKPGLPSRIFLMVEEKDPDGSGNGELINFSVISYLDNEPHEYVCENQHLELQDNGLTIASVLTDISSEPLIVHPENPVLINQGKPTEMQFSATGGYPPYSWQMKPVYHETGGQSEFLFPSGEILTPSNPENGYATIPLPFTFPFYGRNYDTLYMHVNGYLMFEKQDMPYYYLLFDEPYLKQVRAIAGYMNKDLALHQIANNLISATITPQRADFKWRISDAEGSDSVSFTITVTPDGGIKFHYGPGHISNGHYPVIGISNGNRQEVLYSENSSRMIKEGQIIEFYPAKSPSGIILNENGLLTIEPQTESFSDEITLQVSDAERLITEKSVLLTTGPEIIVRKADSSTLLSPGSTVPLYIEIENHGSQDLLIEELSILPASVNTQLNGNPLTGISVPPGQSFKSDDNFSLSLSDTIKHDQLSRVLARMITASDNISKYVSIPVSLTKIVVSPPVIVDGNDGQAEPGEEFSIKFTASNYGERASGNITSTISLNDAFLTIRDNPVNETGIIGGYSKKSFTFNLKSNTACPGGSSISIHLSMRDEKSVVHEDDYIVRIGKPSLLLIDADVNLNSALRMEESLRSINTTNDYTRIIDSSLLNYDYVFLFLGHFPSNHAITPHEDSLLVRFLNQGKSLYLEGGSFFHHNTATLLRNYFKTEGEFFGWLNKPDTLIGIPGTPVEGIQFKCIGDISKSENLLPHGSATSWFADKNSGYCFVTAVDSGNYHTIGSSIEFGGTFMFDSPGRPELMRRYLEFFGYSTSPLSATFRPTENYICKGTSIGYIPVSSGSPQNYEWVFEGGTPSSWEGQVPLIRYDNAGTFSASLTVSNEYGSNTFTLENVVTVDNCNGIVNPGARDYRVYPNPAHDILHIYLPITDMEPGVIILTDLLGRKILQKTFTANEDEIILSVSNLGKGAYLLSIVRNNISGSSKLIIN